MEYIYLFHADSVDIIALYIFFAKSAIFKKQNFVVNVNLVTVSGHDANLNPIKTC